MKKKYLICLFKILVLSSLGCSKSIPATQLSFTEVTMDAFPPLGSTKQVLAPFEADFGHLNNDGCLDILVSTHGTDYPDGHWLQKSENGVCQGKFVYSKTSYREKIGRTRFTSSVIIADFDNDGDQDIQGWDADGGSSLKALATKSDGFFVEYEPTKACIFPRDRCLFIDYDGDGTLELINGTSLPREDAGEFGGIYKQNTRTFLWKPSNDSETSIPGSPSTINETWAPALVGDFNGDSWPDMAFYQHGILFQNNKDAGFIRIDGAFPEDPPTSEKDPSLSTTWPPGSGGMHSNMHQRTVFDYDNDGDMDIFVIRVAKGGNNVIKPGDGIYLLQNDGTGNFTEVSPNEMKGIQLKSFTYQSTYAGVRANDYDNNGLTDLMTDFMDGSLRDTCVFLMQYEEYWEKLSFPCGFIGDSHGTHVEASGGASKTVFDDGDYDDDGLLDIVSSNAQPSKDYDSVALFRNTTQNKNHYLKMFIRGGKTREGWHAKVIVKQPSTNNIITTRELYAMEQGGHTFLHIGLGGHSKVDVEVIYPHDGPRPVFRNINANQTIVVYANGELTESWMPGSGLP